MVFNRISYEFDLLLFVTVCLSVDFEIRSASIRARHLVAAQAPQLSQKDAIAAQFWNAFSTFPRTKTFLWTLFEHAKSCLARQLRQSRKPKDVRRSRKALWSRYYKPIVIREARCRECLSINRVCTKSCCAFPGISGTISFTTQVVSCIGFQNVSICSISNAQSSPGMEH